METTTTAPAVQPVKKGRLRAATDFIGNRVDSVQAWLRRYELGKATNAVLHLDDKGIDDLCARVTRIVTTKDLNRQLAEKEKVIKTLMVESQRKSNGWGFVCRKYGITDLDREAFIAEHEATVREYEAIIAGFEDFSLLEGKNNYQPG